jgi:methionyl-tRNA formyltransferase
MIKTQGAVVFAYHNVGVRCLQAVLNAGVDVKLVVTHADQAGEAIWFDSVAEVARLHGLPCITPVDAKNPDLLARCQALAPEFLFSFYYRHMLPASLLEVPRHGAFNMHGSLLPHYRGRAPVNWAVLHGEHQTGATLHAMTAKPDAGAIVDQCAVPILQNDRAREVFDKVSVAAEIVLARSLPALLAGTAVLKPPLLEQGSYFGGRCAEDGRIAWDASAAHIHNLVRAVAPPEYPGAFFETAQGQKVVIARTLRRSQEPCLSDKRACMALIPHDKGFYLHAADGELLQVLQASVDGQALHGGHFASKGELTPHVKSLR